MSVYEWIKGMSFDEMAEFLLDFANEALDNFSGLQLPSKEGIRAFLYRQRDEDQKQGMNNSPIICCEHDL